MTRCRRSTKQNVTNHGAHDMREKQLIAQTGLEAGMTPGSIRFNP